jgi:hypothetical protein
MQSSNNGVNAVNTSDRFRNPWRLVARAFALACSIATVAGLSGCKGPAFRTQTATGFIALDPKTDVEYDHRAITPDGVVFSVRSIEDESRGDLAFWTRTLTLRVRDEMGYALIDTIDAVSADGSRGKTLKFGHDEAGKPYVYWITVFPAQGRLFIVEAGASKEHFEEARTGIESMLKGIKVRCSAALAPVLASNTCNRW